MTEDINGPLLEVRGLKLGYTRADVIKGIDLDVFDRSVVSLIGANGAGKTTMLRGLSGILRARSGSILFRGDEMTREASYSIARRGIVQVPEGRQVFANMTIDENLRMGAYLVNDTVEIGRRRSYVFDRFPRLAERVSQRAGLLSGGEQQMLAIGRALMAAPRLLLLDEPSMGLAPLFIEEVFQIIRLLKAEGRTILLIEQNAQAALDVSDYAYVMETGRINLHGNAQSIAKNPSVISAYLGSA